MIEITQVGISPTKIQGGWHENRETQTAGTLA